MKLLPLIGCLPLTMAMTAVAQVTETTTTEKTTTRNADGSVSQTTTTTTAFNPEAQTRVVKYFDPYKANPYGLPPDWTPRMQIKKLPLAWRSTRIAPGTVVAEEHRGLLLEAPPALIQVLPPAQPDVRYYVAGGNVVAVDKGYKIVDSLRVPSVKFEVEVDDDEIEIKKKDKDD